MTDRESAALRARTVLIDGSPRNCRGYWHELCFFHRAVRMLIRRALIVLMRQSCCDVSWQFLKPLQDQELVLAGRKLG